ncbi:hypothetical protein XELAEV_18011621mg [Xenopus laevis]|uniref:Uncharacterized protein n=1 Tax=Xenopus laevis TaxID=8355 RepID=A0A974DMZ3_XENLA|nr:hypothetical protein XELAEV_18011621mg [Xenopus laevis]
MGRGEGKEKDLLLLRIYLLLLLRIYNYRISYIKYWAYKNAEGYKLHAHYIVTRHHTYSKKKKKVTRPITRTKADNEKRHLEPEGPWGGELNRTCLQAAV